MKIFQSLLLLTGLAAAVTTSQAQDFAPTGLSSVIFNGTITSATGGANGAGTISSLFTSNGLDYTLGADGTLSDPLPFTYVRNNGTTATLTEAATATTPGVSVVMTFTSATSGTFVATYTNNSTQRGTFNLVPIAFTSPLVNVSTRTALSAGGTATTGFVVGGSSQRRVLVRAIGPGLTSFGVTNALVNPQIALFRGSNQIAANDDYASGANIDATLPATFTRVGAFSLPANSRDAAMIATLEPGPYTAQIRGGTATEVGEVLLEVYFLD